MDDWVVKSELEDDVRSLKRALDALAWAVDDARDALLGVVTDLVRDLHEGKEQDGRASEDAACR